MPRRAVRPVGDDLHRSHPVVPGHIKLLVAAREDIGQISELEVVVLLDGIG